MGGFISMLCSPSSKYDIKKINIGDTKDRVRELFGKPEEIATNGNGEASHWVYTVPFRIYVSIDFDNRGLVERRYRSGEATE